MIDDRATPAAGRIVGGTPGVEAPRADRGGLRIVPQRPASQTGALLLVAIPALNEEHTIGDVISRIPEVIPGVAAIRVLVVDDGSTDRTASLAEAAGAVVVRHPRPRGVGAAFQSALQYGIEQRADLIVTLDADGQFNPADIPALIEPVASGRADFATASRFLDPALTPQMPAIKKWGNRMMSRLVSRLTRQTFYDVSCGMRCYSRRAALGLHLLGQFTYTQEVFMNLAFKQMRIVEIPIRVRGERQHGKSRVASNLWRYALNTSRIIFRCYRDYHPMRFFGGLAVMLCTPGVALLGFLGIHYLIAGEFSPHKWAGFVGATLLLLGLFMLHFGMIGDMLNRHRVYLEEMLYRQRLAATRDDERS